MAELVDAADSKSSFFGSGGSSPPLGTKKEQDRKMRSFFVVSKGREPRVSEAIEQRGSTERVKRKKMGNAQHWDVVLSEANQSPWVPGFARR